MGSMIEIAPTALLSEFAKGLKTVVELEVLVQQSKQCELSNSGKLEAL